MSRAVYHDSLLFLLTRGSNGDDVEAAVA